MVPQVVALFPTDTLLGLRETSHLILQGDARAALRLVADASVHLIVTSPPYWNLKRYEDAPGQMGHIEDYETFLSELAKVWHEAYRVLAPGGRLVVVVGDVAVARRKFGRHLVFPLHADIQVQCRKIGFDNLNPIIWYKIANATLEVQNGSSFLGKPYEPNAIIKTDIEYILMQRKPGGYRKPTAEQRELSRIPKELFNRWFRQIWDDLPGASTRHHPAPYPLELAERLVRMFSFVGDMVLDPFMGTATTLIAAARWGRNSLGIEISPKYVELASARFAREAPGHVLRLNHIGDSSDA
ncbi:MAG: site-specific DNA-methyltransferase [Truepera sp.]|nr:site-specific DNA-methyltransferase [Truepera sp.]